MPLHRPRTTERVRYTFRSPSAVMRNRSHGDSHDPTQRKPGHPRDSLYPAHRRADPAGGAEMRVDASTEAAVGAVVRHTAAALQPPLPGKPVGIPHPGTGLCGLKPETVARLEALGEQLDGGNVVVRRTRVDDGPIAGTRLIREYQGIEHTVTVLNDGFEW